VSVLKFREQIYAGVLGKIIGVYLGRPVEGWSYDKIRETFDEVKYYVHEKVGVPLIVADDDISGTFAFFRALRTMGMTESCLQRRLEIRGSTILSRTGPSSGGAAWAGRQSIPPF
jgi:ADP-ribosylglycohydrolase